MLDFFKPQHHILIQRIYRPNGHMDDQKLSYFIYHLQLKPEKIASSIEYITKRGIREIRQYRKIDVTCAILTELVKHFYNRSVQHETVLLKNMADLLEELVRNDIYVACFREYVLLCCTHVSIRTYKGDEGVNRMLEIVCGNLLVPKTYGITGVDGSNGIESVKQRRDVINNSRTIANTDSTSNVDDTGACSFLSACPVADHHTAGASSSAGNLSSVAVGSTDSNDVTCSSVVIGTAKTKEVANSRTASVFEAKESFFLAILHIFIAHNDLFNKDNYRKRFKIVLNPLLYNFTFLEYRSVLKDMATGLNAINISSFINLFVVYSLKYEVNSIKFLLENVKHHDVIINELNKLISVERNIVLFLFYIEVINWMEGVYNVHEMSRFVFNVLKVYLEQDVRRKPIRRINRDAEGTDMMSMATRYDAICDTSLVCGQLSASSRTDVVEELYKRRSVRNNRFYPCIKRYVDAFLSKTLLKADVLYFFLKQSFQYDFSLSEKTMTVYSRDFQDLILSFVLNTEVEVNLKMLNLLLHISEEIQRFKDTIFDIIGKSKLCTYTVDMRGRHAIMCRIRILYAKTFDARLKHVLELDGEERLVNERLFAAVEAVKSGSAPTNGYNMDNDVMDYECYFGKNRSYANSLKSSLNFENISSKRRSFLRNMDVTKD
ncbi:hypothetical protein VCUG_00582 [Vavraia culicis subsp. floridensis]|uniref:Uncharacterized protein n=1 Tax=Vavraia culicis (isolate floridensis) TaxID=948595 RepID=L2GWJ7_VAVCU|nr:uncharacterized protein VCUG_00582 [Vavraia culicis subsp. floridensis]ELA47999.1 hypothetical protein VCUG_00582 [Vavraia culicis subsp. floridensis]